MSVVGVRILRTRWVYEMFLGYHDYPHRVANLARLGSPPRVLARVYMQRPSEYQPGDISVKATDRHPRFPLLHGLSSMIEHQIRSTASDAQHETKPPSMRNHEIKPATKHVITGLEPVGLGIASCTSLPSAVHDRVREACRTTTNATLARRSLAGTHVRTHAHEIRRQGSDGRKRRRNSRPKSPRRRWPRCARRASSSPSPPSEWKNI